MLALNNLEKLINIENDSQSQNETKLNAQVAEIDRGIKMLDGLQKGLQPQYVMISYGMVCALKHPLKMKPRVVAEVVIQWKR